jgi:hypothetical protein
MTTAAALVLVTDRATDTAAHIPANRLAVAAATFDRLCRESSVGGIEGVGAPGNDQLHILADDEDAEALDALDDLLRDRAQTAGDFEGREAWVLFPGGGIGGCDVWARAKVEAVSEEDAAAMGV